MNKILFFIVAFLCAGTCNTLVAGSKKIPVEVHYRFAILRDLYQAARNVLLGEVGENAPLLVQLDKTYSWLQDSLPLPKSYRSECKAFDALLKIARTELSPEVSHALTVLQRAVKKKLGLPVGAKVGIGVVAVFAVAAAAALAYRVQQQRGKREGHGGAPTGVVGAADPEEQASRLCDACRLGNLPAVQALLNHGARVNCMSNGVNPLLWAVSCSHIEVVQELLNRGADVNSRYQGVVAPLYFAVEEGNIDVVQLLLQHGADVEVGDDGRVTPLGLAVRDGKAAVVRLLLEYGADVEARSWGGDTPLCLAARHRKAAVVQLLLDHGADINAQNLKHEAPLLSVLFGHGADVEARSWGGDTPLGLAARHGKAAVVRLLLDRGADMNVRNLNDETPLSCAQEKGRVEIVNLLRQHQAQKERWSNTRVAWMTTIAQLANHSIACVDASGRGIRVPIPSVEVGAGIEIGTGAGPTVEAAD